VYICVLARCDLSSGPRRISREGGMDEVVCNVWCSG
jgi:hypothetical protein